MNLGSAWPLVVPLSLCLACVGDRPEFNFGNTSSSDAGADATSAKSSDTSSNPTDAAMSGDTGGLETDADTDSNSEGSDTSGGSSARDDAGASDASENPTFAPDEQESASDAAPDGGCGAGCSPAEAGAMEPIVPAGPPVENGQNAELVLGQPDFSIATHQHGHDRCDRQFGLAGGLASDGARLWVLDLDHRRALQFNAQAISNQPKADVVIGQHAFTDFVDGPDNPHLMRPQGSDNYYRMTDIGDIHSDGRVLALADGAHRVLLWSELPTSSGVPWDVVLGQVDDSASSSGLSATQLNTPEGVWTDGERVIVADSLNHRVLVWNSFPTSNGQPADLVLGQADFVSSEAPSPPDAQSMNHPAGVFFDGERLYVSDQENNRVMIWKGMPTHNHQPADYFVGQTSGNTGHCNAGSDAVNPIGLCLPGKLTVAYNSLFITDRMAGRVVVHSPLPSETGEPADAVLGHADLVGDRLPGEQELYPRGVAVFQDKLYVADSTNGTGRARVLRYQLKL